MVTKAIGEMVCKEYGDAAWERIKTRAGVQIDAFVSNDLYPDEMTYQLVGAAAEELKLPVDQVLQAFGRHWILETARCGYGELLTASGRNLPEFLQNLPNFHTRVSLIYPYLKPPRFSCTDVDDNSLKLHYRTGREGLTQFVFGLLDGLGQLFETRIQVQLIESKEAGADHDVFLVNWSGSSQS
jgi:hypothetical protein